jgi:hypothetical protein
MKFQESMLFVSTAFLILIPLQEFHSTLRCSWLGNDVKEPSKRFKNLLDLGLKMDFGPKEVTLQIYYKLAAQCHFAYNSILETLNPIFQ